MGYKITAIDDDLEAQLQEMIKKIHETFGLILSRVKASKIVAWKSKSYTVPLSNKKLLEILGGRI